MPVMAGRSVCLVEEAKDRSFDDASILKFVTVL